MSQLLFEVIREGVIYRIIQERNGHFLIQESYGRNRRSYRINRKLLESIKGASDTFKAASEVYHYARLKRKARRCRAKGKCDVELVSS